MRGLRPNNPSASSVPAPAGDGGVIVTVFENVKAQTAQQKTLSLDLLKQTFASKDECRLLKLATFGDVVSTKGSLRHDKNLIALSGIEIDYDAGEYSYDRLLAAIQGVEAYTYTSARHLQEGRGQRWRILLPFEKLVKLPIDELKALKKKLVKRIEARLGVPVANESYTLSQSFYFGNTSAVFRLDYHAGTTIDQLPDIAPRGSSLSRTLATQNPEQGIIDGSSIHPNLIKLAVRDFHNGEPPETIQANLRQVMDRCEVKDSRWNERYQEINSIVEWATETIEPGLPGTTTYTLSGQGIGFEETFAKKPPAIPFIVRNLFPQAPFQIAGTGGTMKTTMMLYMMMHIILGKDLFGYQILKPGPCVLITGEDEIMHIRTRAYEIARALNFTKDELLQLGEELIVEDMTGDITRLVEMGQHGNLMYTDFREVIVSTYKDLDVAMVVMDPLIYFGPGEGHLNDGPAMLMSCARHICKELQCSTGFLNHVSQAAAQSDDVSQHSIRGGTSGADNARMVGIMTPPKEKYPMPEEIALLKDIDAEIQIIQLHIEKQSFTKCPDQPLWIARDPADPWKFHTHWGVAVGPADDAAVRQMIEEDTLKAGQQIYDYIAAREFPMKTPICKQCEVVVNGKVWGKDKVKIAFEKGLERGWWVEKDLPEAMMQKRSKTYIEAVEKPAIRGTAKTVNGDEK